MEYAKFTLHCNSLRMLRDCQQQSLDFVKPTNENSICSDNHLNENGLHQYEIFSSNCLLHSQESLSARCKALNICIYINLLKVEIAASCKDTVWDQIGTLLPLYYSTYSLLWKKLQAFLRTPQQCLSGFIHHIRRAYVRAFRRVFPLTSLLVSATCWTECQIFVFVLKVRKYLFSVFHLQNSHSLLVHNKYFCWTLEVSIMYAG
jgi:hypothetical protein